VVHGGRTTWGVSLTMARFLDASLAPGAVALETGAGLSTIVILRRGVARHISVTPYADEFEAIRRYCGGAGIATTAWQPVTASSLDWLPATTLPPLDLVLIDGAHAFPAPFVDWYYTAESLKAGGLVVVDDLQLVTARILADFLHADERWDEVYRDRRFAAYRKRVPSLRDDRDWLSQAWVVQSNPVAAVRVIRAGLLRRLSGMAAQALADPAEAVRELRRRLRRD
jgi:predicted O-methyltransferase YrrM